jgi:wyosine [tRNA(Phe)-imidazoG37] synthetase (radical SAM superfamily)
MITIRNTPIVGRDVIFYGASKYAQDNFAYFNNLSGGGVCFADYDAHKQYSQLCGLDILPLRDAILKYPDYDILITASPERTREINDYLLALGIPNDRLFYSGQIELRRGCVYLEMRPWVTLGGKRAKVVSECIGDLALERSGNLNDDLRRMEEARLKARQRVINQESCSCDKCFVSIDDFYRKQIYPRNEISVVFESNYIDTACNANCCYCTMHDERRYILDSEILKSGKRFIDDWHELIELYGKRPILVCFANGEMTASAWCDEITHDLLDVAKDWELLVPTNGIQFNKDLAKLMGQGRVKDLMVSFDSGTRDTYSKVHGVDCFDKVIHNLLRYIETSGFKDCISMKYIILEGVNDNEADFEGFISIAAELKLNVIISNDNFTLPNPMSDNVRRAMTSLVNKLLKNKLPIIFGRHCFLASDYRWAVYLCQKMRTTQDTDCQRS